MEQMMVVRVYREMRHGVRVRGGECFVWMVVDMDRGG